MKISEIKKLAEQEYAKSFKLLGYSTEDLNIDGFYCKKRSDDLTIGIFPSIRYRRDRWKVEFWFGIYYSPIEKEIDALGGRSLATSEATDSRFTSWTTCHWNIAFPPEYSLITTQQDQGPFTESTNNSYLESDISAELIHLKGQTNIDFIQTYTLPWLEQVSGLEDVLERLIIESRLARLPVGLLLANKFDKVDLWVSDHRQSLSRPQFNNSPFWDNILKASAQKAKMSISL